MVAPPSTGGAAPAAATQKIASATPRTNGISPNMVTPSFPYSARRSPPLDMRTVERKGQPASRDPPIRTRPHGVPEAPTYRPTEAEFRDPMEYIRSISEKASKYGICKIIPPEGWTPDFAIDTERFHFRTRRQEINLVEGGNRTNLNYLDQLAKFHKQYGAHLNRFPSVDKRPLDLYKLKKAVEVRGGFERVCKDKKWAEIGRDLGYSGKIMSSLSTSLKNSYQRWLHPYEEYLKYAKPGVHQQLESEQGGSYSSNAPHASPASRPPPSQSATPTTTTMAAGSPPAPPSLLHKAPAPSPQSHPPQPSSAPPPQPTPQPPPPTSILAPSPQPRPVSSSGFTSVNSGFASVNSSGGFTAVNHAPPVQVKSEVNGINDHHHQAPGSSFMPVNGPTMSTIPLASNGVSNPLKRTMSHDSLNGDSGSEGLDGELGDANGRRSKRPKKDGLPVIPGNHVPAMRPSTPQVRPKSSLKKHGDRCEKCGKTDNAETILVCDSCDLGYHMNCIEPRLATIPDYDWHCSRCLVGTNDYGFEEGSIYSLKQFQEKANSFKDNYFNSRMQFDPVTNTQRRPTEDDVEREFWRLVEDITESVEVEYGADIHSTTHGSGFPTVEKNPLNPYSKDPWNLNVMPFLEESLFRHIKGDISGMTVPWLYVGMCFSTFCWHNEDHYAYSANYQHFGATKTWYGIPGKDAYAFENAMRKAVPELFETQPDLLFQLVTILPPNQLRKAGVDVYACDQRAGQFVITFPQAYHAGFNHGFNFNEAVNFAPSDWEPFGETGIQRLQEFRRQPCFSHDELLFTAAGSDATIKTARWLGPALERTLDRELGERARFAAMHKSLNPHHDCNFDLLAETPPNHCGLTIKVENVELEEEDYQCCYCKSFSYLAQFRCHESKKVSCLRHTDLAECCGLAAPARMRGENHSLVLRYTNQELRNIVQKVVDKAYVPEAWEARLDALLADDARPALKALHTLLTEGEKIPHPLNGLDDLSDFVKRCDQWVEEANLYLTRKQQNRRKNDKSWRRSSIRNGKADEKDEPQLTLERMKELIEDGDQLGFTAPQMENLADKVTTIDEWRANVKRILSGMAQATTEELEAFLEEGRGFMAAMPELTSLENLHAQTQWQEEARLIQKDVHLKTLDDCRDLLKRATDIEISPRSQEVAILTELVRQGAFWEIKAKEVMAAEDVHYPQLESLHSQVQSQNFPVNKDTLEQMDAILAKNREAKRQIITLVERSHDPDLRKRPMYAHVRDVVKGLEDLNGKPHGAADLEKELRRHEDWMRKGKKLFGKANAPLHILEQHMKFVEEKNSFCFDLNDTFRPPVEPASREASPTEGQEKNILGGDDEKPVFCICRQPEAGLMIECEICHDWYHAKCLKLARGKVKETEMFTCPICDWRVKIPRDAARPKLEDLLEWQSEVAELPFQPEEEELLRRIVDKAQNFRNFLQQYTNGNQLCRTNEEMPEMLFYLRKIEGAEVLLAYETNIFRSALHDWQPIAPQPPPVLDQSLSTRKPRPTKQQKLMKEFGVEKPEDLPPHLRTKTYVRRKTQESFVTGPLLPKPSTQSPSAPGSAASPTQSHQGGSGETPAMQRQNSTGGAPGTGGFDGGYMAGTTYGGGFGSGGGPSFPARSPSPMFSASGEQSEGLRDPMMGAFSKTDIGERRSLDASFPLFRPESDLGLDGEDDLRNGLANASASEVNSAHGGSPAVGGEYDNMFIGMSGQDGDGTHEGVAGLEHERSHASEALDVMSPGSHGEMEDKHFDDFLNGEGQS